MTDKINDGGPAFPIPAGPYIPNEGNVVHPHQGGMSLRDWFAGMALQGILANDAPVPSYPVLAKYCYEIADAMLKKREVSK